MIKMMWKYLSKLAMHKWYVFLAGIKCGVPVWRLVIHDLSKLSRSEYLAYRNRAYGDGKIDDRLLWGYAWLSHANRNPHHPQYWIMSWNGSSEFSKNYYDDVSEHVADFVCVLPMPEVYVREMVADWHGASKVYTGSWNIASWINTNGREMILHSDTESIICKVMSEIGYENTDNCMWSFALHPDIAQSETIGY